MRTRIPSQIKTTLPRGVVFYFAAIFFIGLWWGIAFYPEIGKRKNTTPPFAVKMIQDGVITLGPDSLSALNRNEIQAALSGQEDLMCQLILEWDLDAQILQNSGHDKIRRLTPQELFFTKTYLRESKHRSNHPNPKKYLPYTYDSAGILLALLSPKNIAALPKGFRSQSHLFPLEKMQEIPSDIDPFHIDQIDPAQVEHAFIAPHSHPITLKAMEERGINLINLGTILSLEELCRNILQIGEATTQNDKSRLLASFVKSAFYSLDNRLKLLNPPKTLYLDYFTLFSAPTSEYFYGKLIQRSGMNQGVTKLNKQGWRMMLEMEDILDYNPECLVISTHYPKKLAKYLTHIPAFSEMKAVKENRLYLIDQKNQESPSQYFVLAYFDLVQALQESVQ